MPRPLTIDESYVLPDGRRGYLLEIREDESVAVFGIEVSILVSGYRPNIAIQATGERVVVPLSETAGLRKLTDNVFRDGMKSVV